MRVSVVMPVYDPPIDLFDAAVRSVLDQPHRDCELILVDDGSTRGDVQQALSRWEAEDERVIVYRRGNGGPSRARNAGTQLATGEYVMYLDADDELSETAIVSGVAAAIETGPDLVLGFLKYITSEGEKQPYRDPSPRVLTRGELDAFYDFTLAGEGAGIYRQAPGTIVKNGPIVRLIKSELAKRTPFPEELVVSEDTIWNLLLLSKVETATLCSDIWYWYWVAHGSTSRGFRADAPAETRRVLDALAASVVMASRPAPHEAVLKRILGEVNRATRTYFAHPRCTLGSRKARREIRSLLAHPSVKKYVSLKIALRAGPQATVKYGLCATGLAFDYWRRQLRARKSTDTKRSADD